MNAALRLVAATVGLALAPTRETRRRAATALLWAELDAAKRVSGQYDLPLTWR